MYNMIIMGPPGAGKGTQSEKILKHFAVPHISTGDMFREAIANKTELGLLAKSFIDKGAIVPDEVTISLVKERISKDETPTNFILSCWANILATVVQALIPVKLPGPMSVEI